MLEVLESGGPGPGVDRNLREVELSDCERTKGAPTNFFSELGLASVEGLTQDPQLGGAIRTGCECLRGPTCRMLAILSQELGRIDPGGLRYQPKHPVPVVAPMDVAPEMPDS